MTTTTKTITINYLDRSGSLMHAYRTGDDYTADEIAAWEETLNDTSCEHPEAPEGWDQFELVATDAE